MNCHFLVTLTSLHLFFLASTERCYTIVAEAKQKLVSVSFVLFILHTDVSDLNLHNAFVKAGLPLRILPYHGSLTSELGIPLNSRFSFGRNGAHSDRRSARMSYINCLLLLV